MKILATAVAVTVLFATPLAARHVTLTGTEPARQPPVTHTVRMEGDGSAYWFAPATITVRRGDRIRFVNVSGGPHNVAFDPAKTPDDVEAALAAGMPDPIAPMSGPLMVEPNAAYTMTITPRVRPGRYEYYCMPHVAMGMTAHIVVR